VPIDREETLRRAEKLLRQGRLDAAILEFLRVVEEQPRDFNTANLVGDLYVRAGQVDKAVAQYSRIADSLAEEGFLPKAAALYKKIIKIKPSEEQAILKSAEICLRQGLMADARSALGTLIEQRTRRGDRIGASELIVRLGDLDQSDLGARLAAARAAAALSDREGAVSRFKAVGRELLSRGEAVRASEVLAEAVELAPDDAELRSELTTMCLEAGDIDLAQAYAATGPQLKAVAEALSAAGRTEDALSTLELGLEADPEDSEIRLALARSLLDHGRTDRAARVLEVELEHPEFLLLRGEVCLRRGYPDEARHALANALRLDPEYLGHLVRLAATLCQEGIEDGYAAVELAVESACESGAWLKAADLLNGFLASVPAHLPALLRLVEVAVDGELGERVDTAQAQLADAYLALGRTSEARVIAEDLLLRHPGDERCRERLRQSLIQLGESDPDEIIAETLAVAVSNDALAREDALGDEPVSGVSMADEGAEPLSAFPGDARVSAETSGQAPFTEVPDARILTETSPASHADEDGLEVFAMSVESEVADVPGTTSEHQPYAADGGTPPLELDLTYALDDLVTMEIVSPEVPAATEAGGLDAVFGAFKSEMMRQTEQDGAVEQFRLGVAYEEIGMFEESAKAFLQAARSPAMRFEASLRLAQLYRSRGMRREAIEWLERGAEAPAPDVDAGRALLYELARGLEEMEENARALAVLLELEADAPGYRDVPARIQRLSRR
jgi:tetratricopeptide (TPR) repeat protein